MRRIPAHAASILFTALLFAATQSSLAQYPKHHEHHEHKHIEREQIVALEHDWQQAALADNVAEMDKLLSDDYIGITATGEVLTKNQELDHLRDRKLVIAKLQSSDVKIKLIGSIAIVTSLAYVNGIDDGEPLHGAYRYTRVYQRVANGVWKITNFEVTPAIRVPAAVAAAEAPQ